MVGYPLEVSTIISNIVFDVYNTAPLNTWMFGGCRSLGFPFLSLLPGVEQCGTRPGMSSCPVNLSPGAVPFLDRIKGITSQGIFN